MRLSTLVRIFTFLLITFIIVVGMYLYRTIFVIRNISENQKIATSSASLEVPVEISSLEKAINQRDGQIVHINLDRKVSEKIASGKIAGREIVLKEFTSDDSSPGIKYLLRVPEVASGLFKKTGTDGRLNADFKIFKYIGPDGRRIVRFVPINPKLLKRE